MNEIETKGVSCVAACAGICLTGCSICFVDGPIFVADTATGGPSLASGTGSALSL